MTEGCKLEARERVDGHRARVEGLDVTDDDRVGWIRRSSAHLQVDGTGVRKSSVVDR